MSGRGTYHICLCCLRNVRSVEKYCEACESRYGLRNDLLFFDKYRFPVDDMERKEIIEKDKAPGELTALHVGLL